MYHFIIIILSVLSYLLGWQVWISDFKLLTGHYNYRLQAAQFLTYVSAVVSALLFVCPLSMHIGDWLSVIFTAIMVACATYACEFFVSKINGRVLIWSVRFVVALAICVLNDGISGLWCCALMGLIARNSPLGVPYAKDVVIAHRIPRKVQSLSYRLEEADSFAGRKKPISECPVYNVSDYGIVPGSDSNLLVRLQEMIDEVGAKGGGRIFFPQGRYEFKVSKECFIRINHSHITLEGEIDAEGRPLAELYALGATVDGTRNPWISPFFITTGEQIQPSNIFFGLQFNNRSEVFTQSSSLTDPGSDGSILTPQFATNVVAPSMQGQSVLHVEDSSQCGRYIMIGLYNTTADGNLIKEILGVDVLRSEWTAALRAGREEAPSFQWLVEVEKVVDEHTLQLSRPLLRDIPMHYSPKLYNVEMLEDVNIINLKVNCSWNGMFHHHGIPLYYSVAQSQAMDYGWNGICMKRVAHGSISNVEIRNFTNPLYVFDSRNITAEHVTIGGNDGHQGIKIYQHACDNLFRDITFTAHFADMMGGEGNAYGNVFENVVYRNPVFKPVDFDFHGFSEGPMSPPAYNLFCSVAGFRRIQSGAGRDMLPGCAQHNSWNHIVTEGERKGEPLFIDLTYKPKTGVIRIVTAVGYSVAVMLKLRSFSPAGFVATLGRKLSDMDAIAIDVNEHQQFFVNSHLQNISTTCKYST